uniref:ShKT domain-containing protein n=1 Tax=Dracunculus medinensis TaxID=318479 RepID=A0A0N4UH08_DRAME
LICRIETALTKCPHTCRLCNRPGAAGRCPDVTPNCSNFLKYMECETEFMQLNCMRTCNLTSCFERFHMPLVIYLSFKKINLNFLRLPKDPINKMFISEKRLKIGKSHDCLDRREDCQKYRNLCYFDAYQSEMTNICRRTCEFC